MRCFFWLLFIPQTPVDKLLTLNIHAPACASRGYGTLRGMSTVKQQAVRQIENEYAEKVREADALEARAKTLRQMAEAERSAAFRAIELMSNSRKRRSGKTPKGASKDVAADSVQAQPAVAPLSPKTTAAQIDRLRTSLRNVASTKEGRFTVSELRPLVYDVFPEAEKIEAIQWTRAMRWLVRHKWIHVAEARAGSQGSLYEYVGGHSQAAMGA